MSGWDLAHAVAELQHFIIAPWQLRLMGIRHRTQLDGAMKYGWRCSHFDMIALPGEMSQIRRLAAAILAYSRPRSGPARVAALEEAGVERPVAIARAALEAGQSACGPSAAWMHEAAEFSAEHWIRLPGRSGHIKRQGVQLRYGAPAVIQWKQGLPVGDPNQTIADLAACADGKFAAEHDRLCRQIAKADRLRLTSPKLLRDWLDAAGPIDGAALLGSALDAVEGRLNHSEPEGLARELVTEVLRPYGLTLHPRPYEVWHQGHCIAEADLAVVELRYDIEVDGPHHLLPAQIDADQVRDRRLRQARWTVDRFSTAMIETRPREVAAAVDATVRQLLALRAENPGPR